MIENYKTLREILLTVDSEEYSNVPIYQTLLKVKPEYGSAPLFEKAHDVENIVLPPNW